MAFRFAFVLALGFIVNVAFANEGGGGGGEEAKKEGGKDSGALPEWVGIEAKLQTLRAKISAKDKTVRELIKLKETEKDPAKNREHVQNMKTEHRELRQAIEDYERQLSLLKYRYPEKGLKEERYKRVDVKSLAEMEKQIGMEGRLKQVSSKVRRQYGEPETTEAAPVKKEVIETENPKITEPPVLSK